MSGVKCRRFDRPGPRQIGCSCGLVAAWVLAGPLRGADFFSVSAEKVAHATSKEVLAKACDLQEHWIRKWTNMRAPMPYTRAAARFISQHEVSAAYSTFLQMNTEGPVVNENIDFTLTEFLNQLMKIDLRPQAYSGVVSNGDTGLAASHFFAVKWSIRQCLPAAL